MAGGVIRYTLSLDSRGFETGLARASTLMKVFASGAVVAAMKSFLDAQSEAEEGINQLNLALANQGKFTEGTSKSLQEFASQMQRTTRFSDDAVIKAQALLASFGMNEAQIKRTTKAAADYGAATGKDLTAASETLAKAFVGKTTALEKLGFQFAEGMTRAQKFESALRQMEERFGGSAAAKAATFTGQMEILKNTFGDVQESLGKLLGQMLGSGKPFDFLISAGEKLAHFFGVTLILALNQARVATIEFIAMHADLYARVNRWMSGLPSWALGPRASSMRAEMAQSAAGAEEFSRALRAQIPALREEGNAAAFSAGNLLAFGNATDRASVAVDELTAAQKKLNEELAKSQLASEINLLSLRERLEVMRLFEASVRHQLPTGGPGTTGLIDTPGAGLTGLQAHSLWLDKYGATIARWNQQLSGTTDQTKKWKVELSQVVQMAVQLASIFADVSGKAAAVGAALGGAAGTVVGGLLGGQAGAAAGGAIGGLIGGLVGSLFGRSAREAERLKKAQDEAVGSLKALVEQWEKFRKEILDKGVKGLGDLFGYFATKANLSAKELERLGFIGLSVFQSLRKAGYSVVDALTAMGAALDAAIKAGIKLPDVLFGELGAFRELVLANEQLVRAAEALAGVFDLLRLNVRMTQEDFDSFLGVVRGIFDDLTAAGFSYSQVLGILAPILYRIQQAAKDLGLVLDANTQKWIDDAEAAGLFKDLDDPLQKLVEIQQMMLQVLAAIAHVFGVILPEAVQKYIDKLREIPTPPPPPGGGGGGGRQGNECYDQCRKEGGTHRECRDLCEGFAQGTGGLRDFGTGSLVRLHGQEAVVTAAQWRGLLGRLSGGGEGGDGEGGDSGAVLAELRSLNQKLDRMPRAFRDAVLLTP